MTYKEFSKMNAETEFEVVIFKNGEYQKRVNVNFHFPKHYGFQKHMELLDNENAIVQYICLSPHTKLEISVNI